MPGLVLVEVQKDPSFLEEELEVVPSFRCSAQNSAAVHAARFGKNDVEHFAALGSCSRA